MAGLVPNTDPGKDIIIFVSEGEASLHWCMSKGIGRGDLTSLHRGGWRRWDNAVSSGNLLEDTFIEPEDPTVIRPFGSITRHGLLKFDVTKDRAWFTATGITLSDPPSGHIEVRNMRTDRSKILEGMVSCIAEVEVYDKEKALLVWASVIPDFKLRLCVQQVDPDDSGQPFIPVDVKIDMVEEKDYPRDITVLHPLPIVAVMTEKSYSYFFELNTGAYLYSQAQKSYQLCPGLSDKGELLLWSHEKSDVQVLTVNEGDLIDIHDHRQI
ncbi:hypothetical protein FRC03_008055 [Tulasnella sp. 419]|nr:hypothetical protein FRC03_008055 [Tulasnella sp. 419]